MKRIHFVSSHLIRNLNLAIQLLSVICILVIPRNLIILILLFFLLFKPTGLSMFLAKFIPVSVEITKNKKSFVIALNGDAIMYAADIQLEVNGNYLKFRNDKFLIIRYIPDSLAEYYYTETQCIEKELLLE